MYIGIGVFVGSGGLAPQALGRAVEERGFESLFLAEHTHIPLTSRRSDGRSVREYADTHDPFVALSAAAAVTTTIKLGTGVCLVTQRDPIVTAKSVASLDLVSGGRFLFGVGAGWNQPELANHGTEPRTRTALLAERVHAMREIWTTEEAAYHGEHVDFDPIWSWPKPLQRPHPPVLVGGNGPGTEDRVLSFGDGWLPQAGPLKDVAEFEQRTSALRRRASEAGRGSIPVTVFGTPPDPELLDALGAAGADRCLLLIRNDTVDAALSLLDSYTSLLNR